MKESGCRVMNILGPHVRNATGHPLAKYMRFVCRGQGRRTASNDSPRLSGLGASNELSEGEWQKISGYGDFSNEAGLGSAPNAVELPEKILDCVES